MKTPLSFVLTTLLGLLTACSRPTPPMSQQSHEGSAMTTEVMLRTTPVKDQGPSGLCWVYAMLATIETDRLMQGDSVNLSPDYIGRKYMEQQASQAFMSQGQTIISQRGMAPMLLRLAQTYGLIPYDSYPERTPQPNGDALSRRLQLAARHATTFTQWRQRLSDLLDGALGSLPADHVFMLGAEYTPREFAHSVCQPADYESLTSFTHHPFGDDFVLEVADNRFADTFHNVPLDTLISRIDSALHQGHAVCWEGDISEPDFSFDLGKATLSPTLHVTQQLRQRLFERRQTTDDHAMALVGILRDAQGHKYYMAKNSWGTDNPLRGFMLLSESYVRLKTISVTLQRSVH